MGAKKILEGSSGIVKKPAVQITFFNVFQNHEKMLQEDFSCEIEAGQVVGVLGLNGSGKSTLMRFLAAHVNSSPGFKVKGAALVHGVEVNKAAREPKDFAGRIIYFGGGFTVPEKFTTLELFNMSCEGDFKREDVRASVNSKPELRAMALESLLNRELATLSEGEQQWVMLSRLVYQDPKVLILDESVSKIDFFRLKKLSEVLRLRSLKGGLTFVVSHDYRLLFEISQSLLVISQGKANIFSIQAAQESEEVKNLFGGEVPDWIKRKY